MKIIPGHAPGAVAEQRSGTFTGAVWLDPIMPATDGAMINNVFFTPGARTHWHRHGAGQVLYVVAGTGLVCAEGDDEPHPIRAGDTVWTAPGELHWHGAAPDGFMLHLAVSLGSTEWHDPVSDDQYPAGRRG